MRTAQGRTTYGGEGQGRIPYGKGRQTFKTHEPPVVHAPPVGDHCCKNILKSAVPNLLDLTNHQLVTAALSNPDVRIVEFNIPSWDARALSEP